ncbi:MAG: aldose 1-epimerase family protein [Butyrivibrio sp.]|nr:aldose 1-epimerase family protein [Butyrivibrio sp.]
MLYEIKNDRIIIKVSDEGAELKSVKKIRDEREFMWQADKAFWGRTSPVLFPLVGNYYNKQSRYKRKTYNMSQHGFARDMVFTLVSKDDSSITFELKETEETLEKYPFAFRLYCSYELIDNKVIVSWRVINPNCFKMYFSIGAHPAFNCDLDSDRLLFEKDGKAVGLVTSKVIASDGSGCMGDEEKSFILDKGLLQMSDELFMQDALVIEDRQSNSVSVTDPEGKPFVKVTFDAPLFGVWSPVGKHAPFVCIEPWYGRCDKVGFIGDLSKREYSNTLEAGGEFRASYTMEFDA